MSEKKFNKILTCRQKWIRTNIYRVRTCRATIAPSVVKLPTFTSKECEQKNNILHEIHFSTVI